MLWICAIQEEGVGDTAATGHANSRRPISTFQFDYRSRTSDIFAMTYRPPWDLDKQLLSSILLHRAPVIVNRPNNVSFSIVLSYLNSLTMDRSFVKLAKIYLKALSLGS